MPEVDSDLLVTKTNILQLALILVLILVSAIAEDFTNKKVAADAAVQASDLMRRDGWSDVDSSIAISPKNRARF